MSSWSLGAIAVAPIAVWHPVCEGSGREVSNDDWSDELGYVCPVCGMGFDFLTEDAQIPQHAPSADASGVG